MPDGMPPLPNTLQVQVVPHAKPWWTSRILIVNALALALAMAESQLQLLKPVLPVDTFTLLAFLLPVVNAGLRLVTTTAVSLGQPVPVAPAAPAAPPSSSETRQP